MPPKAVDLFVLLFYYPYQVGLSYSLPNKCKMIAAAPDTTSTSKEKEGGRRSFSNLSLQSGKQNLCEKFQADFPFYLFGRNRDV